MPMIIFTVFYIPSGLFIVAGWINRNDLKKNPSEQKSRQNWFFILLIIGVSICLPKLFKIIGTQKNSYRETATWLNKNTASTDIVAVPDMRIAFYAERKGIEYSEQIPGQVDYIVRIVKSGDKKQDSEENINEEYSTWVDRNESRKLVIYKVIRR